MVRRRDKKSKNENLILIAVLVVLTAFGSFLILQGDASQKFSIHTHPDTEKMTESHEHDSETQDHAHGDSMNVPADTAPTVDLRVFNDPKSGYNFQIVTSNFEFSPQNASLEHVPGEGHAHIYVDDVKINRIYGEWYHIASIEPGTHEVRVTLNSNNHMDLAVDGELIQDIEILEVSE